MHIESVTLRNFRCFGEEPTTIGLAPDLTAFIGTNGTGKTATCHALQRLFGTTADERAIRADDFHVPASDDGRTIRSLTIDAVLAFPELDDPDDDALAVPGLFAQLTIDDNGIPKCRIVLQSTWTTDGTVDGSVETSVNAVQTLDPDFDDDQTLSLPPAERSRIQVVYVPASRDGARQVTTFLRGRLWRAAQWSDQLRAEVAATAEHIGGLFRKEGPTRAVEARIADRWKQLHGAGTHATPRFQPLEPEVDQLLRGAELTFEPDHGSAARPARLLSDGQRSLLHLALTAASLDIEEALRADADASGFDVAAAYLPTLTVLAVEEPENNLAPFYLSRISRQLLELGATSRTQVVLSSHSASSLTRIDPGSVRYFRHAADADTVRVRAITLPDDDTEAGKYVREAVRAHPELYFARFVVLGEGDSEQVVLPTIARALGVDLDPAFVAMVPLGGRHTQHFWRLLTDLEIPHATLLDLDYGRAGGGPGRLRTACVNLREVGVDVLRDVAGFDAPDDIADDLDLARLRPVRDALREHGVFFSGHLDLDMLMLTTYWQAYTALEDGERGPADSDATDGVLGVGGPDDARRYWAREDSRTPLRPEALRWYRYLFANRSKPATHLRALTRLTTEELKSPPDVLAALLEFVRERIEK